MTRKPFSPRGALSFFFALILIGCNGPESTGGGGSFPYHISYYETAGNAEQPVTTGAESTITVWFEVDSPETKDGRVYVDDLHLERSDMPGVNLASNPSFEAGLWSGRKNNAMTPWNGTWQPESDDGTLWTAWTLSGTAHSGSWSSCADMSVFPNNGYQTHFFLYPLLDIQGIRPGITFRAHAYVRIVGNVQARLGIDFRNSGVNQTDPRLGIRAVNGMYLRGDTGGQWVLLNLRNG